jgi:hypothetical protein
MTAPPSLFRLYEAATSGPTWDEAGLALGGVRLFRHEGDTFEPRPSGELAILLARTNRFSEVWFNRGLSTISPGTFQSLLRPDVTAVARPELDLGYRFEPYEIFSPRQNRQDRQAQFAPFPGVRQLDGRTYKFVFGDDFICFRRIGV